MIKGCKKNVVWIRNTGSEMFDEAYFIVSDKGFEKKASESDMLTEASRLISESPVAGYFCDGKETEPQKKQNVLGIGKAVWFMIGASVTTVLNAVIYYIV